MKAEEFFKKNYPITHDALRNNERMFNEQLFTIMESYTKQVANEDYEKCNTCGNEFHVEGTIFHWDTGRRQCIKCYTKQVAVEFLVDLAENYVQNTHSKKMAELYFDEWNKKGEQIKCSECGAYFDKKEIIIKGDEDTCDECLCPE